MKNPDQGKGLKTSAEQISLYIHFPFCVKKCLYCDFNSVAGSLIGPEEYAAAVVQEMELRARLLTAPIKAPTLFLGGGTPSLMAPHDVALIVEAAGLHYGLDSDAEITIEANPGTVSFEKLKKYRAAGVNRLSLGVQSFNTRHLARLGRVHSAAQALDAFSDARAAGFSNIGIDLIHSLPDQTVEEWIADLETGIGLGAEHISAYGLSIEEGTPFQRMTEAGDLPLPGEETALRMFRDTASVLQEAGYEHYEISNYALQGCRSRHNQVYWQRTAYLGFGAGAHSFTTGPDFGCRWRNVDESEKYMRSIRIARLPDRERSCLDRRSAMGECLFLGLRMLEGVDEKAFWATFGASLDEAYPSELPRLLEGGLLQRQGGRLRLTEQGILLYNQVVVNFL